MAPWVWFIVAVLAAAAGGALLLSDYGHRTAHSRQRRRWAALRGWRFTESDPVLPDRWRHGAITQGGPGEASDLVTGRLFTSEGRRPVHVFDHRQHGKATSAVVAVRRREGSSVGVLELWKPDVPAPNDAGLELLGPVGARYAFVTDLSASRRLITPRLVAAADEIGDDVPVAWLEQDWVLATVPSTSTPARLERLLRTLGEIADQVDGAEGDGGTDNGTAPGPDAAGDADGTPDNGTAPGPGAAGDAGDADGTTDRGG